MNYNDAMKYIHEVGNFGSNYGLERTYRILEILHNPQKDLKLIHVAGTNGKGSVTAMISSMLRGCNFKVGMYTSPFLEEFEERIQINGCNIPKDVLGDLVERVKYAVDKVIEEGYTHPTEFEIITCLMLLYFKEEKVDYGVIEVGLGGRLDSTNVITPILGVITSISLDHTNLLGNTLREIASEKAGIIKEGVPVVTYPQEKEALEVIEETAKNKNAELIKVSSDNGKFIKVFNGNERIYQDILIKANNDEYKVRLPLLGKHQVTNLLVAMEAFFKVCNTRNIKFSKDNLLSSLKNVKWIGRLEVMKKNPLVVIDGAHNIQGIKSLKESVKMYFKYKNIYLILGILADKQVEEMIKEITPMAKKVFALTPHSDRAELASKLKQEIVKINENCVSYEDYKEAYMKALEEASDEDLILISGSLYMIGDMRKIIRLTN